MGPAYNARNGAPSAYRSVTSTVWNELAMSQVSKAPGLGIELDLDYLNSHRAEGEPEWAKD